MLCLTGNSSSNNCGVNEGMSALRLEPLGDFQLAPRAESGISATFLRVFTFLNPGPDPKGPGYDGLGAFKFQPNMQYRAHRVVGPIYRNLYPNTKVTFQEHDDGC